MATFKNNPINIVELMLWKRNPLIKGHKSVFV